MDPGVPDIVDTMLLAYLSNRGSNVWVPSTAHAGEEVVLDLEVQSSSKVSRNGTSIGRRCFNLRLEPANSFASLLVVRSGITVRIDKVVRQREEEAEGKTFTDSHEENNSDCGQAQSIVGNGAEHVQENVLEPQRNGNLSPLDNVVILHLNAHILSTTLTKIHNLGVEYGR